MTAPREMTDDEVREAFLDYIRLMVAYWVGEGSSNVPAGATARERLEGLAHSILVAIDCGSTMLPAFVLSPVPYEDDKAFYTDEGINWFPCASAIDHNIAGVLHERFYQ